MTERINNIHALEDHPTVRRLLNASEDLPYHNRYHTKMVMAASAILAQREELSNYETEIVKTAALFHDLAYVYGPEYHEVRRSLIAMRILKAYGYDERFINYVRRSILATDGYIDSTGKYRTTPDNIYGEILCDADLSIAGLSTPRFMELNGLLRKEMREEDEMKWLIGQVSFLKGISWHTNSAHQLWDENRIKNIAALEELLEDI